MTQFRTKRHAETANKTAPVTASPVSNAEFTDFSGLYQCFGIKRSLAYQLLKEKAIDSISLRRGGKKYGKRLISISSVRAFLKSQEANQ
jgi:hypothetical protein